MCSSQCHLNEEYVNPIGGASRVAKSKKLKGQLQFQKITKMKTPYELNRGSDNRDREALFHSKRTEIRLRHACLKENVIFF